MDKDFEKKVFLERCFLPSKIDGYKISLDNVGLPLVGIKGFGDECERKGKRSVWVCGEILSPNFIGNDNCSCRSHIEGIVTEDGKMRLLESVYSFPAFDGSCFEYNLSIGNALPNLPSFKGEILSRLDRNNFQPRKEGQIYLALNSYWEKGEVGQSIVHSLPYYNRQVIMSSPSLPNFWKTFLGEIEEEGYEHPYGAVSEKLSKEREEKKTDLPF